MTVQNISTYNFNTSRALKTINYINFYFASHAKITADSSIQKFIYKINYNYNFYYKDYENYIKNYNILDELYLKNIYKTYKASLDNKTNFSQNYLENGFINNELDSKFYFFPFPAGNKNFNNFIDEANSFKYQAPFYTEISFSDLNTKKYENSLRELFEQNAIFAGLLNFYHTSPNTLTNVNFKNLKIDDYLSKINNLQFKLKLNDIIEKNKLIFNGQLSNKNTYYEIIAYKISKFSNSGVPLQEFYIPSANKEKINFIDTQVFYNKLYKYKISYIFASIGTFIETTRNYQSPTVFLVEFKNTEVDDSNYILDTPPLPPEAQFISYVGVTNKFKINLNSSVGTIKDSLNIIKQEERDSYERIKQAQNPIDNKITFSNDEPCKQFHIYKLDMQPSSYEDFSSIDPIIIDNLSSGGSYEDAEIEMNKKYYYAFRSMDVHDHFSNLSDIYEFEIINDAGSIYPVLNIKKIKDYENINFKDASKKMKKHLLIKPNYKNMELSNSQDEQYLSSTDSSSILNLAKIGTNNINIWDKKFKIRITSLSSGKKIDFNVNFDIQK